MNQQNKQLLLIDLCARLPWEVILVSPNGKITYQTDGNTAAEILIEEGWKPYLRPMSSMTKEEKNEYLNTFEKSIIGTDEEDGRVWTVDSIDWLNAHHFDYRGLIPLGLAKEAPKNMYVM